MSHCPTVPEHPKVNVPFSDLYLYGLGAGIMDVSVMTVDEKVVQYFTLCARKAPNSMVPGYLQRLLSLAAAGIIRVVMSANGGRGPFADFMFVGIRFLS
ncbi:hypothetical protein AJ80_00111 [Polytolypa hystricis UAMH7299]|uniref:Uncharacterized protein n=1 Tax=Polytolypa hystricis (strain UAMH7299) TaxID=1447883 RepID=A0A2B7Z4D8_POLH7|nr:hypothetical protein AJ80_00111 [Polytolypa hystricis UAMH7299]